MNIRAETGEKSPKELNDAILDRVFARQRGEEPATPEETARPSDEAEAEVEVSEAPTAVEDTPSADIDENEEDVSPAEGEKETEEAEEEAVEAKDEVDYLDVSDDDLIELSIDGEIVYKPLRELKEALSGEGAIQKRLKEATEERKAAQAERSKGLLDLEEKRQKLVQAVGQLEQQLFPSLVPPPDPNMRNTDPQRFLQHESAYRADQERIAQSRQQLAANIQDQQRQHTEALAEWRKGEQRKLAQLVPDFADEQKLPAAAQRILNVANHYGVSQDELATFGDHRLFRMAYDAAKYLELQAKAKVTDPKAVVEDVKRNPRRLRTGVAQRKMAAKASSQRQKEVMDRARTSGKVDDIAATLLKPRS